MNRTSRSNVAMVALGILIGALIAKDIGTHFRYGEYFWVVGALLGGLVTYVAIDFRDFCAGVVRSYRETITWRPHRLYWRAWFARWVFQCCSNATSTVGLGLVLVGVDYCAGASGELWNFTKYFVALAWPVVCFTLAPLIAFATNTAKGDAQNDVEYEEMLRCEIPKSYAAALWVNPFGIVYCVLKGVCWTVANLPQLIAATISKVAVVAQFAKAVFVQVHSRRRTIGFVDVAIGVAIAHVLHETVAGIGIGVVVGVAMYVIQCELVAVRWLKIVPA